MEITVSRNVVLSVLLFFGLLVDQSFARKISFRDPTSLDVGSQPFFISIADIDLDNDSDIVVANTNSDSITVWLNDGRGSFFQSTTTSVPDQPNAVAIGNFNGGPPDVVSSNHRGSVSVLFGDGTGNFPTRVTLATLPVANGPRITIAGKLNLADNFDDISVSSDNTGGSGKVSVWLGDGVGGFSSRSDFSVAQDGGQSLAATDFEPDGDIDLVTANAAQASISVLLNDGSANFTTLAPRSVGLSTVCSAVGSFNGDAAADLVVVDVSSSNAAILLGNGDGTFVDAVPPTVTTGTGPTRAAIADFNADRKPDLIVTNWTENSISIFKGKKKGQFKTLPKLQGYADLAGPISIATGDLNDDGMTDFVVGNFDVNKILIFINKTHRK
jgi:hypothetical protein